MSYPRSRTVSRRAWIKRVSAAGIGAAMMPRLAQAANRPAHLPGSAPDYNIYFGDLHNHNAIGYAKGSLARTFEIANRHLDFFAFTPHAHWHDIGQYEGNIEQVWHKGFAVTREYWPDVLAMNRKYDVPGRFVTIPGYEWHSTHFGDYHVLYPDLDAELFLPDDLQTLQQFVKQRKATRSCSPANIRVNRLSFTGSSSTKTTIPRLPSTTKMTATRRTGTTYAWPKPMTNWRGRARSGSEPPADTRSGTTERQNDRSSVTS